MNEFEELYNNYFNTTTEEQDVVKGEDNNNYTYKSEINNTKVKSSEDIPNSLMNRTLSEDNIDDIDEFAAKLEMVMNAAWGIDWGEFGPELREGEDPENVKLPQITYDVIKRVYPDKKPIKPVLMDTVTEVVNGKPTGDHFLLYRQWFDYVVEFNIFGNNSLEARRLMKKFETLISLYTGYIKQQGISELLFLQEIHSSRSSSARDDIPMRTLMYVIRVERITIVRASTIRNIEISLNSTEENKTLMNFTINS